MISLRISETFKIKNEMKRNSTLRRIADNEIAWKEIVPFPWPNFIEPRKHVFYA